MFEIVSYILSAITVLLLNIDRNQTLQIKDHPELHEVNVLLGKHPSDKTINTYFAGCILIAAAFPFVNQLPSEWAVGILGVTSLVELVAIVNNVKNKLKIKLFW